MEAARRLDEWRVLSRKIPHLDMVPEFVVDQNQDRGQIQLNTSEWLILSKINGKHDIRMIAKSCNLPVFDVCKVLYGLVTQGLVALKETSAQAAATTVSSASEESKVSQKLLDQTGPNKDSLLQLLEKIRGICNATLGKQAEAVVDKQCLKAKSDIEQGGGMSAIQEAVTQIAKASSILKGPSTTEMLLEQLKTLKL